MESGTNEALRALWWNQASSYNFRMVLFLLLSTLIQFSVATLVFTVCDAAATFPREVRLATLGL